MMLDTKLWSKGQKATSLMIVGHTTKEYNNDNNNSSDALKSSSLCNI